MFRVLREAHAPLIVSQDLASLADADVRRPTLRRNQAEPFIAQAALSRSSRPSLGPSLEQAALLFGGDPGLGVRNPHRLSERDESRRSGTIAHEADVGSIDRAGSSGIRALNSCSAHR
jgi:hypothetical protein